MYLQQEHINLLKKYFIDVLCIKFSFIRFRYFVCGCGICAKLKMQNTILSNDIQYIKTSIGLPLLNHKGLKNVELLCHSFIKRKMSHNGTNVVDRRKQIAANNRYIREIKNLLHAFNTDRAKKY